MYSLNGLSLILTSERMTPTCLSSSIWTRFRSSSVTPHFFLHFFASIRNANRFWNNGWILIFKVSKQPYWSVQHDRIIWKWRHFMPVGQKWNQKNYYTTVDKIMTSRRQIVVFRLSKWLSWHVHILAVWRARVLKFETKAN